MKIVLICPWFYPNLERGGTPIAAYNFALGLADKGCDVTVLTTSNYASGKFSNNSNFRHGNFKTFYLDPVLKFLPRCEQYSLKIIFKFFRLAKKDTIIYLHTSRNIYSILALILKKLGLIKGYVICPHGSYTKSWIHELGYTRLKAIYILAIEQFVVKNALSIHYLDENEAKNCSSLIPACQHFVVPNGIDVGISEPKLERVFTNNTPIKLVFIGRIHPQKNLFNLVLAISEFECSDVVLDIYGPVDDVLYYEKLKKVKPSNVSFKGYLSNQRIPDILLEYDLFVLCSIVEGVSIALLEALRSGSPILYTNGLANSNQLDSYDVGFNVGDGSVEDIFRGIKNACANSNCFDFKSENAIRLCEQQYSKTKISEKLSACFEKWN